MIVASLLLIVAAAVLLVLGLVRDANLLLILSIAVSLLAAVALYLGARQARTTDGEESVGEPDRTDEEPPATPEEVPVRRSATTRLLTDLADSTTLHGSARNESVGTAAGAGVDGRPDWPLERHPASELADTVVNRLELDQEPGQLADTSHDIITEEDDDGALSGEPPRQRTPRADADLIARLPAEVLVVDGRPRYHVTGCPHLLDLDAEPLAVSEAVELGFSPCGWCQPDTVLLGGTPER